MHNEESFSPKIIVYGLGFVGQRLVRLAAKKKWEIVAAFNRDGDKIGKDIGRLAGLEQDLGVLVQDCDSADYSELKADIALIATTDSLETNFPAYERFLNLGINVLCHAADAYSPYLSNPAIAEKIEELAKRNNVTFTGSGIWDMTRLWSGIIVSGPCVEISSLLHASQTEIARQGAHFLPILGVGLSEQEYIEKFAKDPSPFAGKFHFASAIVLGKWGFTVSNVKEKIEPIICDHSICCSITKKIYNPGTCIGSRFLIDVNTNQGVTAQSVFDYRIFSEGELEEIKWKVTGTPSMEIKVVREDSDIASASSLFNRIPDVIAAGPGIVEITDMAPERHSMFL